MKLNLINILIITFIAVSGFSQDYIEYLPENFTNSQWYNTKSINNTYSEGDTAYYTSKQGGFEAGHSTIHQYHRINEHIKWKTEYRYDHKPEDYCHLINVYNIGNDIHLLQGKCDEKYDESHENLNHFWVYDGNKNFVFDFEVEKKGLDPVYSGKKAAGLYYFIIPIDPKQCILLEINLSTASVRLNALTWKDTRFNTRIVGSVINEGVEYLLLNSHYNQDESYDLAYLDTRDLTVKEQWRSNKNIIGITQTGGDDFFILSESDTGQSGYMEFHLCDPFFQAYKSKKLYLAFKRRVNQFFNRTATVNDKYYCAITNNTDVSKAAFDYVFVFDEELQFEKIIIFPFYIANIDIHGKTMTAWNPQSKYSSPIIDYKLDSFICSTPEICETPGETSPIRFDPAEYIESIKNVGFILNNLPEISTQNLIASYDKVTKCIDENIVQQLQLYKSSYCQGENLQYFAQPITNTTYSFRLFDENQLPLINNLNYRQNISTSELEPGTYSLVLEDRFLGCELADTVHFDVYSRPNLEISPMEVTVCPGETVNISASASGYNDYQWKYNGSILETSLDAVFSKEGKYVLEVQNDNCTVSKQFTLNLFNPTPNGGFTRDTIKCDNPRIPIRPITTGYENVKWNTGENEYFLWVDQAGNYIANISTECDVIKDTIIVEKEHCPEEKPVYLPNTFTPNGDGVNDIFPQRRFQEFPYRMQVFNRWGELVFECEGSDCHWRGNYKLQDAPQGVYVYRIIIDEDTHQGSITLLR